MTGGRQDGTGDEDRKTVRTWENKENEQRGRREGSTELGGMKCWREGGRMTGTRIGGRKRGPVVPLGCAGLHVETSDGGRVWECARYGAG